MSQSTFSASLSGLDENTLTLRQASEHLGTSTTTLRKLIRQGRLPEAEKVRTPQGRVWTIPFDGLAGIALREGFVINLDAAPSAQRSQAGEARVDYEPSPADAAIDLTSPPVPETETPESQIPESQTPETQIPETETPESQVPDGPARAPMGIQSLGAPVVLDRTPGDGPDEASAVAPDLTLAEVVDAALLETLLGAKESEAQALVVAERKRSEYDALAARQLEIERNLAETDAQRQELAERLRIESLARAIADARVIELRDQLQREITYAETERRERRQAVAREAAMTNEVADVKAAMGWRARRRLGK